MYIYIAYQFKIRFGIRAGYRKNWSGYSAPLWGWPVLVCGWGGVRQLAAPRDIYAAFGLFGPLDKGPSNGWFSCGFCGRVNFFHLFY